MAIGQAPNVEELAVVGLMPPEVRALVSASFVRMSFAFGDVVVSEGHEADGMYVVASGSARVIKRTEAGEITVSHLGPADIFGEGETLAGAAFADTVRASADLEVLRLDAALLRGLSARIPEIKRYCELHARQDSLRDFLRIHSAFSNLATAALAELLSDIEEVPAAKGALVVRQGDPPDALYVVAAGHLCARRDGQNVGFYRDGDFFGEGGLLAGTPAAATVEALSDSRLLRVSRSSVQRLMDAHPSFRADIEAHLAQLGSADAARVPLDFEGEILPAHAEPFEHVGPDQIDEHQVDAHLDEAATAGEADASAGNGGPFATPDGRFVKSSKRIRRFPHVWQVDEADCGAACLAMVCRHFGRAVNLARVRQAVRTGIDGTSLQGITRGAEELGLAARALKASKRNLDQMPLPAVVHWDAQHWVVVYDVSATRVRVDDPALGIRRFSREEFERRWSGYVALFERTPAFEQAPVTGRGWGWAPDLLQGHRKKLGLAAVLALVMSAAQMLVPVFIQLVIDRVLPQRDFGLLRTLLLAMIALTVVIILGTLLQRYLLSRTSVQVDRLALDFLADRLLALPMTYFYARRTGDIQRRLAGVQQIRQFVIDNGIVALTALTQLLAAIVIMFFYSRTLALVFLAALPLYFVLVRVTMRRLRPIFESLEEAFGKYYSRQIDAIKGIEAIKAMGAEQALRRQLAEEFNQLSQRLFRSDFTTMCFEGGVHLLAFLSLAAFILVGALQVLDGHLSIGGLVTFNALVVLANAPITSLLAFWDRCQLASVVLTRLTDVVAETPEQGSDHSNLIPVATLAGHVGFHDVGFRYGAPDSPAILEGITFDVPAGTNVAIVGRSGSGKTTLIKCLVGLVAPTAGTITYDGLDVTTLHHGELRRQIGFVLQENFLFSDTIARNIAFGDAEPDMARVEWAAKLANAHSFVSRLPLGYETKVGEAGLLVSGGQRQRIAIARAVYRRPPIIVFDEATSALDTESEKAVQSNMGRLLEGRTSFVIAHRLSTIRNADVILVLEKGRLVEHGTHEELMARKGLYFYLCSQQLQF